MASEPCDSSSWAGIVDDVADHCSTPPDFVREVPYAELSIVTTVEAYSYRPVKIILQCRYSELAELRQMLTMTAGRGSQLSPDLEVALATYRYEVFIETLHWQLPVENGLERDQFDRPDTLYVIARDARGSVCGCARLLPTTRPYLLDEVFPGLMNGAPAPHAPDAWELSRFSTKAIAEEGTPPREEARRRFCALFAAVVEAAIEQGASRLITFTAMGVERILRSIGMHAHRVGPPQLIDGEPVLALWIELDDQTRRALQLPETESTGIPH
ncbi:acyl-homoserine-lactone synthase [Rhodanobacter sp. C01]|uniref:acyl-homoserine-lactone synthase n=1 Tax=Rhodanobacter sp. C01 TaxID=1945856 RepID=UPI00269783AE|nr:acyl-homoserine-lactone synthase [Rhodanobacter sp. C01]